MSKVDILIPAYNSAHFLQGALDSVLAQTVSEWRILLVDDGSTDTTREFVDTFCRENAEALAGRLTYIYQENRGLPAARNTGIRAGKSPLIALLDADDQWLPTRLENSVQSFEGAQEVGLSYGGISRFDLQGDVLDTYVKSGLASTREGVVRQLYTRAIHFPCPTVTFRRECVEAVGLFDETMRATEDRDMWLRIAQRFSVVFVPKVLALYRVSAGSMSKDLPRLLTSQRQFINKHAGEMGCGWAAQHVAMAGALEQQAAGYRARGERRRALRFALEALGTAPWLRLLWRTTAAALLGR